MKGWGVGGINCRVLRQAARMHCTTWEESQYFVNLHWSLPLLIGLRKGRGVCPGPHIPRWRNERAGLDCSQNALTLVFFFFWPCHETWGVLVPCPEIKPGPWAISSRRANHGTARNAPVALSLQWFMLLCPQLTSSMGALQFMKVFHNFIFQNRFSHS